MELKQNTLFSNPLNFLHSVFENLNYLGIFAPQNCKGVKFKLKITRHTLIRALVFAALTAVAVLFDWYFEKHPAALEELQTETKSEACDHGAIYLFSQSSSYGVKTSVQKTPGRKLFDDAHDKLLQKCHQLRHHQAIKAETAVPLKPLFLSYHHLIFRHYFLTFPDDDPPVS
jgi:hypothetical protein